MTHKIGDSEGHRGEALHFGAEDVSDHQQWLPRLCSKLQLPPWIVVLSVWCFHTCSPKVLSFHRSNIFYILDQLFQYLFSIGPLFQYLFIGPLFQYLLFWTNCSNNDSAKNIAAPLWFLPRRTLSKNIVIPKGCNVLCWNIQSQRFVLNLKTKVSKFWWRTHVLFIRWGETLFRSILYSVSTEKKNFSKMLDRWMWDITFCMSSVTDDGEAFKWEWKRYHWNPNACGRPSLLFPMKQNKKLWKGAKYILCRSKIFPREKVIWLEVLQSPPSAPKILKQSHYDGSPPPARPLISISY